MQTPPLSLYVHIPWCVQKCPYCDFNSHGLKSRLPEQAYVAHLLDDLAEDAKRVPGRVVRSIFIGGGTPSLFRPESIHALLTGIRARIPLAADAEITLEANPGTVEAEKFRGFYQAGVNRLSIGVQSFQAAQLSALGRIHDSHQAKAAAGFAREAGLPSFNLDLMHGLPGQDLHGALDDLQQAIAQQPPHLSWYQLTIEPNTAFASKPPTLPEDDILWEIQEQGEQRLVEAGYQQYEISAYSLPGHQCQHNLNYWRFGDYLGIGCGAHGKISDPSSGEIWRTVKVKHPKGYMDLTRSYLDREHQIAAEDRAFEFFMNRLRLLEPCPKDDFAALTGSTPSAELLATLTGFVDKELLIETTETWQLTAKGKRYLNSLLEDLV